MAPSPSDTGKHYPLNADFTAFATLSAYSGS